MAALGPFQLDPQLVQNLIQVARPVYNLAHIVAGHELTLDRSAAGNPEALSYRIDTDHVLWLRAPAPAPATTNDPPAAPTTVAAAAPATWTAAIETIHYDTRLAGVAGTLKSSLYDAVNDAGEQDTLAVNLANLFSWDMDFNTDTRPGDTFRVLVEKKYLDGKFAHYGQIVAAEYVNAGHAYQALRFHDKYGELAYYRPNGEPLKREFLTSPLRFAARITSGFSLHRYHPILHFSRAHLGTDFAAPIGTPVQAVGAGVVVRAGRSGEDGNMIELRHANGYNTFYLHLSRILVHIGQRVSQGQTIGRVGETGLATGPHLHFGIQFHGRFENWEVVRRRLPPANPVPKALSAQFQQVRAKYMPRLAALKPPPAAAPVTTASNAGEPRP